MTTPPIPPSRPPGQSFLRAWQNAKSNLFAALPDRLYRAWLAETRTPLFTSYVANQPTLVREVLVERPEDFPKSRLQSHALTALLGRSIFVANGADWAQARRLIDPALSNSRPAQTFEAMLSAAEAMAARLPLGQAEIEVHTSRGAADVICRTLFSVPVEGDAAHALFDAFRRYQQSAPVVSLAGIAGLPGWLQPLGRRRRQAAAALGIRKVLEGLVAARQAELARGTAPDDLATALLRATDPDTGQGFSAQEVVDQIAVFFLAGHETSASALAWALYCVAGDQPLQDRLAAEAQAAFAGGLSQSDLPKLRLARNVFRETLRLYPPVAMVVRESRQREGWRGKRIRPGSPIVLSPWHMGRHRRLWPEPDRFDPDRWDRAETKAIARQAWLPFSAGPRGCPGAGFALQEGVLMLSLLLSRFRFSQLPEHVPEPVLHLTVRARDGIWLKISRRADRP